VRLLYHFYACFYFIMLMLLPDYYTLKVVGQEEFEDVKVPDAPQKPDASK
jgi:hypothetical protein